MQDDAAGAAAAKAAFYAQQATAYEEAEERRLFDLRVRTADPIRPPSPRASCRTPPSRECAARAVASMISTARPPAGADAVAWAATPLNTEAAPR